MQTLDYEAPKKKRRRLWLFWPAFLSAYYVGITCVGMIDDARHIRATGWPGDGGVAIFGAIAFPFFAVIAIVIKSIWKRCNSLLFGLGFPVLAPLLVYLFIWFLGTI